MNEPIKKFLKAMPQVGDVGDYQIRVIASGIGDVDRTGDVIFPGAYKPAIAGFKQNGFVAVGHDWDDIPVAMPLDITENGRDLVSVAEFHKGVQLAEETRAVCMQRAEKGLSVSVSVGFMPDYDGGIIYFESGEALLKYAKDNGYDMSLFDTAAIKAWREDLRAILRIKELFEWSIVTVGAHRRAKMTDVKSFSGEDGSLAVPLSEDLDIALAAVKRANDAHALRKADGRRLSPDRLTQLKAIQEAVSPLIEELEAKEQPTENDNEARLKAATLRLLTARAQRA
jgi:hypothetical protein